MTARLKTWFEKLDDFLERNRRYVRPSAFIGFLIVSGVAVYFLILSIATAYVLGVVVGVPTIQLLTGMVSAISAIASATAAFLIYRGNVQTRRTMVKPRIFVYGSTREARQQLLSRGDIHITHVDKGGILVENMGEGPAVRGTLYVVEGGKERISITRPNQKYTFLRLRVGEKLHYPNLENRELEKYVGKPGLLQQKIRIQLEYHDIDGVPYELPEEEQDVELFPHPAY